MHLRFTNQWIQAIFAFAESKRTLLFIVLTLAYIAIAMNMPVSIYTLAGHDDALFMNHAYKILRGEWLGDYSQMTLVKGIGYSLFLAANCISGIPITLSIAIFYAFSCWLLINILIRLQLPVFLAVIVFAFVLFHPDVIPTRIIRDNIYPSLTLIVLAAALDVCLLKQRSLLILFFYGCSIALFYITREEGIWILPGLLIIFIFRFTYDWRSRKREESIELLKSSSLLTVFFMLPIIIICSINQWKYGAFLTVDFKEPNFSRSLSLLNSIEVDTKISHVPVNAQQREIAYSISPAFAELKDFFEKTGTHWTQPGCAIYPETCGDYAGGWFMWAYRDAVFEKGYYTSFAQAKDFYHRVATEINTACESEKIQCKNGSFGFLPKLSNEDWAAIPNSIRDSYLKLTVQTPIAIDSGPSMDSNDRLDRLRFFLRQPFSMPSIEEDALHLVGWFYASSAENWLILECRNSDGNSSKTISRHASPDIAAAMKDPTATNQRFSFKVTTPDQCDLVTNNSDRINLNIISPGAHPLGLNATIFIDSATKAISTEVRKFSTAIKYGLADIYKIFMPILFWLGLITCTLSIIQHALVKKAPSPLVICAIAVWTLVFSRSAILILIDISSFPAITSLYMGPIFPLVIIASSLSITSFRLSLRNI